MRAPARACVAMLAAALCAPRPASAGGLGVVQNLVFAALSDWGGQTNLPFTTSGQLSAAASLAKVAATARPRLVVSAGGNFLDEGLPGARARPRAGATTAPCRRPLAPAGRRRRPSRHARRAPARRLRRC
jgi:hypothetical protein